MAATLRAAGRPAPARRARAPARVYLYRPARCVLLTTAHTAQDPEAVACGQADDAAAARGRARGSARALALNNI